MKFFEDSCLFTAMSQCLNGCPVLGKTLSFQFGKSEPWGLECPNKLLYVAQWIGGIPASHGPAYDVMCDTTPACRKPLQFSVSQNVLLLEVLFSPFNLNWNLLVPLEIESQFLSRTCSCISPSVGDWNLPNQLDDRRVLSLLLSPLWHCTYHCLKLLGFMSVCWFVY